MTNINSRICLIRKHVGVTQKEFADAMGVSRSYLSEVENEKGKASVEMIVGIATFHPSINLSWLLTGKGEMLNGACNTTGLDLNLLQNALDIVEWGLKKAKATISTVKKAELVVAVYDFCQENGVPEEKEKLLKLVSLVA